MALARLALKNLQRRLSSSPPPPPPSSCSMLSQAWIEKQRCPNNLPLLNRILSTSTGGGGGDGAEKPSDGRSEISVVSEGSKKSKLFPKRQRKRSSLWRNNHNRHFVPSLYELFPSGLGNALMQATESINRLVETLSPGRLIGGRVKEQEECYKLRYDVPGLAKEDVKITVEDGILRIKGEHKEEEEGGGGGGTDDDDDYEYWSSRSYGYYDTSLVLPEDAKVEEVKAEMKDGVLTVIIPRTEKKHKKDVKEVQIH